VIPNEALKMECAGGEKMTLIQIDKAKVSSKRSRKSASTAVRFSIPWVLVALAVSGCAKHLAEAGGLFDGVVTNSAQADGFFDALKAQLASEGFSPSEPAMGFIAAAGLQPSGNDQIYWFKGSYRGSPPFYVKLIRDGPHLEGFHLSYYWEVVAYTSPEKEMGEKTLSLHKTLIAWAKDDKTVYVPPGS
jgi:hypothetical protein